MLVCVAYLYLKVSLWVKEWYLNNGIIWISTGCSKIAAISREYACQLPNIKKIFFEGIKQLNHSCAHISLFFHFTILSFCYTKISIWHWHMFSCGFLQMARWCSYRIREWREILSSFQVWLLPASINTTWAMLEMQIHRPYPRPRQSESLKTVDVLTSSLDDSEAHGSSRTNDNIQSFHFTMNKIETETGSAPCSVLSPGFHVTSSFRYYPHAVGFQVVTSLTFFPKTHSQLLYLTPVLECCRYLRSTGTKPLSSPVSHISANVRSLAQLFKLEAWESSFTPLPHPPLFNSSKCQFYFWKSSK